MTHDWRTLYLYAICYLLSTFCYLLLCCYYLLCQFCDRKTDVPVKSFCSMLSISLPIWDQNPSDCSYTTRTWPALQYPHYNMRRRKICSSYFSEIKNIQSSLRIESQVCEFFTRASLESPPSRIDTLFVVLRSSLILFHIVSPQKRHETLLCLVQLWHHYLVYIEDEKFVHIELILKI